MVGVKYPLHVAETSSTYIMDRGIHQLQAMNIQPFSQELAPEALGDITKTITQITTVTLASQTTLASLTSDVTASGDQPLLTPTLDVPIDFGTSEPNSSLITGLSIGLPVAVIVILLLVIIFHYYKGEWLLRHTLKTWFKQTETEDAKPKLVYLPSYCDGGMSLKSYTLSLKLPSGDPFTDTVPLPSPVVIKQSPAKFPTLTKVKDRLSRLVHIQDFSDLQSGSTNGALMQASGAIPARNPQSEALSLAGSQVSDVKQSINPVNGFSAPPKIDAKMTGSSNNDSDATRYPSSIIRGYIKPRDSSQTWDRDVHINEFVVIRNYTRRLGDELTLRIGDRVIVHTDFPDGWSEVSITKYAAELTLIDRKNDGERGVVPTICIHKI